MSRYLLRSFSAAELISEADGQDNICIDLAQEPAHPALIHTDQYAACALYDQLKLQLGLAPEQDGDCLINVLVYVDFDRVPFLRDDTAADEVKNSAARKKLAEAGKRLLENGFCVTLPDAEGGTTTIHYRAFEKSASMAREQKLTYLADGSGLYDAMYERLSVGIAPPENTALAKWYAYRGLYLSTAKRIAPERIPLDEKTVIVIEDDKYHPDSGVPESILTAEQSDGSDRWTLLEKQALPNFTSFDGEGLISPVWGKRLSEALGGGTYGASSFQIRAPFTKGMVHQVDFHTFFRRELLGETAEQSGAIDALFSSVQIRDYFGCLRTLSEAQMILPASMFKCCHWLKQMRTSDPDAFAAFDGDPMRYFFAKCSAYDHALYVGNDNVTLCRNNGWIKLNYQFLNPAAFTPEVLDGMIETHMRHIGELPNDLLHTQADADSTADETQYSENRSMQQPAPWQAVVQKYPAFFRDPYIRYRLETAYDHAKRDIFSGRIFVRGEMRFLSRDLLAYLLHAASKCTDDTVRKTAKTLKANLLFTDTFYMPQAKLHLYPGKPCLFLRNPHLSRNEEVLLKAYTAPHSLYETYFGHLSGVVQIGLGSWAADALGGADFDGDLVKIVSGAPAKAVMDAVYEKRKDILVRKLPVIQIPSTAPKEKSVQKDRIDYNTVRDTFRSQVGKISNLAIRWGKLEYAPGKTAEPADEIRNKTAECTILTGLEIDAAKSGRHPSIAPILRDDWVKTKDPYLKLEREFSAHGKQYILNVGISAAKKQYRVSFRGEKKPFVIPMVDGETAPVIDRLPTLFAENWKQELVLPADTAIGEIPFARNTDPTKQEAVRDIIAGYHRTLARYQTRTKKKTTLENRQYRGYIQYILMLQYGSVKGEYAPEEGKTDALYDMTAALLRDGYKAGKALRTLIAKDWQFVKAEDRETAAKEILSYRSAAFTPEERKDHAALFALLSNFSHSGYMLLYYLIKDCVAARKLEPKQKSNKTNDTKQDRAAALYEQAEQNNWTPAALRNALQAQCREALQTVFASESADLSVRLQAAIPYAYAEVGAAEGADPDGRFFWEVFSAEEILTAIEARSVQRNKQKREVRDRDAEPEIGM